MAGEYISCSTGYLCVVRTLFFFVIIIALHVESFLSSLGEYPPLPPVDQVDFSLLTDEACNCTINSG